MFLIKECPSCFRKLRFPIDKGRLRVQCLCGYQFLVDPDDPSLYNNAEFDIAIRKKSISIPQLAKKYLELFIRKIYDIKYQLQNFPLLPTKEQYKIVSIVLAIFMFIFIVLYLLCSRRSDIPVQGFTV